MFAEWISSIDCSNIEKNGFDYSLKCINNDDTIIIFNYTDTFERLFCLSPEDSRVCHIHGKASDKKTIIVGHGRDRANCKSNNLDCCSDYMPVSYTHLSGNDDQIVPILSLGGKGVISVLSNVFPRETSEMCKAFFRGETEKSRDMQLDMLDLINALFCDCLLYTSSLNFFLP